ncbi:MAG: flagellar export protein FliJ [Nitrospirae bacterium]|nr:flagellar export protein FliJ [Nitrospirota bacterium]
MKHKSIRFDPLLKYREFLEETMKYELAEVLEILDLEEKKLFALEEICNRAAEELKERQERSVPPHEIFMYHSYLQQITLDMEVQRRRVAEVTRTYNERKTALTVASQDKKVVERAKEKEIDVKKEGVSREDKKVMNEISNNRYLRNN